MQNTIAQLEPKVVFGFFEQITRIPRASKKEEKIREYLRGFAVENGLEFVEDPKGNIVIRRDATIGCEGWTPVILQSHMDMVCEKERGSNHNFDTDPIEAYVEDGWVKARGTTLGADCGIGMAMQMAVLVEKNEKMPAVEALFTVDEEQGLSGAMELGEGMLRYKRMINLDSEDQGEIFIGCAGGVDTIARFDVGQKSVDNQNMQGLKIVVAGLNGGHSGDDIDKGRASATKVLARVLWKLTQGFEVRVIRVDAGNLRNAIARDGVAEFMVEKNRLEELEKTVKNMAQDIKAEFSATEQNMKIELEKIELENNIKVFSKKRQTKMLLALIGVQNGVLQQSMTMPGLVETSSNLASLKMVEPGIVEVVTSQRSMVESAKWSAKDSVAAVFRMAGAEVRHSDGYPGWKPNPNSSFVQEAAKLYMDMFDQEAKIRAIHAGLECGLLLDKYPQLDIISFGPTLRDVHSPSERMEIKSVEQSWKFLVGLLQMDK